MAALKPPATLHRLQTAGARSAAAAVTGLVVGIATATGLAWQTPVLLGWIAASLVYLTWTWLVVWPLDGAQTRRHAASEDPSRRLAELIVLVAGVALLGVVALALVLASTEHGASKALIVAALVASTLSSWFIVHTVFTLRYARSYYAEPQGGIDFNQQALPTYLDFAYLAFTIGMTFQVSDTDLETKEIRRTALGHMLLSYLFGAVLIALMINIVASLFN